MCLAGLLSSVPMECLRCHKTLPEDADECLLCGGPAVPGHPTELAAAVQVATHEAAPPPGWFYRTRGLAKASTVLLLIAAVVSVVTSVADVQRYRLLGRIVLAAPLAVGDPLFDEATRSDDLIQQLAIVQLLVELVTLCVFLNWVRNTYGNGIRLGSRLSYSAGWAVGWWFVPVVNLVRPKRIVDEIWQASSPGTEPGNVQSWQAQPRSGLIPLWWGLWLTHGVLSRFAGGSSGQSTDTLRTEVVLDIVANVLQLAAALVLVVIIRRITTWQSARQAAVGA
jgi:hypothetical protein